MPNKKVRSEHKKIMLWLFLIFALVIIMLLVIWIVITQPFYKTSKISALKPVSINSARLEQEVRQLSEHFHPRNHPANLNRAANYIIDQFKKTKGRISEQNFLTDGNGAYRNIILSFGPEDGPRIVVGAHYDAVEETTGADDNASGVAGLFELSRLLDQHDNFSSRIDLVAYALEEPPYFKTKYMGSSVHAHSLKTDAAKIKAMIALEMIGYFRDEPNSQHYPLFPVLRHFYPNQGNFIAIVGSLSDTALVRTIKGAMIQATSSQENLSVIIDSLPDKALLRTTTVEKVQMSDLPVFSINAPRFIPGIDFSDHLNFWNNDYPAVMITDTAFYRNPNYHRPEDTPEKLDYAKMAQVIAGVYASIMVLSSD